LVYYPGIPIEGASTITGVLSDASVDGTLASVTVTRDGESTTYLPGDWVGATLTAYGGSANGADLIMPPTALDAPAPGARANMLGDGIADTGFVNLTGWSVSFAEDVVNRPGPDILLFDFGGPDTIDVTINGTTMDNAAPTTTDALQGMSGRKRFLSDQFPVSSLSELENATFFANGTTSGNNNVFGLDLSDFGFGEGASLLAGTEVVFSDGSTIDPMEIIALLEPTILAGDYNGNGVVDAADYTVWRDSLGGSGMLNDPTPEIVDQSDYVVWKNAFGQTLGVNAVGVPEPTSALLFLGCLLPLSRRLR
jgi:hypothetical protein